MAKKRFLVRFFILLIAAVLFQAINIEVASAFQYRIFGQANENSTEYSKIGNGYTFVQFDSVAPDYVWGNVKITYDNTDKVECISIEEPMDSWGFWTWWTTEAANPAKGGGGSLYHYSDGGGAWAEQWVGNGYGYGLPGSIDRSNGSVYFYASTYAGDPEYTKPLRLGLRLKKGVNTPVTVTFKVASNDSEEYNWVTEDLSSPEQFQVVIMPENEIIQASVEINPDVVNLKSKGQYITAYIQVPGQDIHGIDISSIRLNDTIPAELKPLSIGDDNLDGVPDLMVKFSRAALSNELSNIPAGPVDIKITGTASGLTFAAGKTIRLIK